MSIAKVKFVAVFQLFAPFLHPLKTYYKPKNAKVTVANTFVFMHTSPAPPKNVGKHFSAPTFCSYAH